MNELLAACGAFVFVNMLAFHKLFKWMNRKPFYCEVCMSGWFCLILSFGEYWLRVPFKMALAMCLSIIINSILKKL